MEEGGGGSQHQDRLDGAAGPGPGRSCPLDYRYPAGSLDRAPDLHADTLYVAGGVYGNEQALHAVLELHAADAGSRLVFNGDFNWFNVDAASFGRINRQILAYPALRGNVETELAAERSDAGCGCAYPGWVGDAEVERSNAILARLRETALSLPGLRASLGALPPTLLADIGGARVAIVHGDLESLAGWDLAQELADDPLQQARIAAQMARQRVQVVASSHTCLPLALGFGGSNPAAAVINNGAAGMPNFKGSHFGVVSRISVEPSQHIEPLYSLRVGPLYVEALAVHYAHEAFVRAFLSNWPPGSPAYVSYACRIEQGPEYALGQALRRADFGPAGPV